MPIDDKAAVSGTDVQFDCEVQPAAAADEEIRIIKLKSFCFS